MSFLRRFRFLFRRDQFDRDMADEMHAHVDEQTQLNIEAGMDADAARAAAHRQFGGVAQTQERARDVRGFVWLEQLVQDLRYACRQLRKSPGFTAVAIITLALGIGSTTAIFSVVNTMILNPIAAPDPERLVQIGQRTVPRGHQTDTFSGVSPPVLDTLLANRDQFAGFTWCDFVWFERQTEDFVVRQSGAIVPEGFFELLNAHPRLGRTFLADEVAPLGNGMVPARDTSIVLSHAWWESHFGSDPQVLGRKVEMSGRQFTVVGVMPAYFQYPTSQTQFWVPTDTYRPPPSWTRAPVTRVIALLKPEATAQQAQAMLDTLAVRLMSDFPSGTQYGGSWRNAHPSGLALWVRPLSVALHDGRGADELHRTLFGLLAAILFVLLIICANIANLTLARVERRQHELAVRAALGAARGRLMRQLLTENLLLALCGGAAGLLVTTWAMTALPALSDLPRLRAIEVDGQVLGVGLAVSIFTALLFGLAPMWQGGRRRAPAVLSDGGSNATSGRHRSRYREGLVIVQVAVAVVLLTGAGLMLRSVVQMLNVDPGFDPKNLLLVDVPLPWRKYEVGDMDRATQLKATLYGQLHERFAALPGVEAVGLLHHYGSSQRCIVGARTDPVELYFAGCGVEDIDGFKAMRVPLLEGRYLNRGDIDQNAHVVINEAMAAMCWPGESAIGRTFHRMGASADAAFEVVGVVRDAHVHSVTDAVPPTYFRPYQDGPGASFIGGGPPPEFILRVNGDPSLLVAAVRRELKEAEPNLEMPSFAIAEQVLYDSTQAQRTYRDYLSVFAGVGLLLSALGIYGVLAYSVARRTREIGIRMAVGAECRRIVLMVMADGARLVLTGVAAGFIAAFWLTRYLRSQLFEVSPTDPGVLASVLVVLSAIGLLACYLPARRAARVDPVIALRAE